MPTSIPRIARARSRTGWRSQPMILPVNPDAFTARANDPPMRPVPIIVICLKAILRDTCYRLMVRNLGGLFLARLRLSSSVAGQHRYFIQENNNRGAHTRQPAAANFQVSFEGKRSDGLFLALFLDGNDFIFLDVAHHFDHPLVNVAYVGVRQWPVIGLAHILKNHLLPMWLVNRHARVALELSDFPGGMCSLIQKLNQAAVQFVNFVPPVNNVHDKALSNQKVIAL